MKRVEFFVAGCKAERWRWRGWRLSLFTLTKLPATHKPEPFDIDYREDGVYFFNGESKDWVLIEDSRPGAPLLMARELASFPADSVPNHPEPLETTFGRLLFNWMVVNYSFESKIPFTHKLKDVIKAFVTKVKDEPEDGTYDPNFFYPNEVMRFVEACYELTSLCEYISPTGTVKSLTTHPDMIKFRNALYEEAMKEGELTPNKVVEIQNKCIEKDKEWLADGPDADYYISGSAYSVKRKKMFGMVGMETAFREPGDFHFVPTSLSEGQDLSAANVVAENNSVREGSYDRGADTALGGAIVNILQRIFQNHKIIEGDCGTKHYDTVRLNKHDGHVYVGFNMIEGGSLVEITSDYVNSNIGKVINIRRPILCKAPHTDFCAACAGNALARQPRAVAAEIVDIGSRIMYAFMQSMHGVSLSVSRYNYLDELT